jgi:hypothetical protein
MPRKKFTETTFTCNFNEEESFLQTTGQMNCNIIQIKEFLIGLKIPNSFISPEYGMISNYNNNEYFHLLKGNYL